MRTAVNVEVRFTVLLLAFSILFGGVLAAVTPMAGAVPNKEPGSLVDTIAKSIVGNPVITKKEPDAKWPVTVENPAELRDSDSLAVINVPVNDGYNGENTFFVREVKVLDFPKVSGLGTKDTAFPEMFEVEFCYSDGTSEAVVVHHDHAVSPHDVGFETGLFVNRVVIRMRHAQAGTYEFALVGSAKVPVGSSMSPMPEPTAEPTTEPTAEPTTEPTVDPSDASTRELSPTTRPSKMWVVEYGTKKLAPGQTGEFTLAVSNAAMLAASATWEIEAPADWIRRADGSYQTTNGWIVSLGANRSVYITAPANTDVAEYFGVNVKVTYLDGDREMSTYAFALAEVQGVDEDVVPPAATSRGITNETIVSAVPGVLEEAEGEDFSRPSSIITPQGGTPGAQHAPVIAQVGALAITGPRAAGLVGSSVMLIFIGFVILVSRRRTQF